MSRSAFFARQHALSSRARYCFIISADTEIDSLGRLVRLFYEGPKYLLKRFPWFSRTFLAKVTLQNRLKMTISAATTYGQNYNLLSNLTALRKSAISTSSTTYERNVRQIGNTKQSLYQSTGCANKKQSPRKNSISPEL